MEPNVFITWCSPAGSTGQVADMIRKACEDMGVSVHTFDMGKDGSPDGFIDQLTRAGDRALLFVGSPVYKDVAIPPVTGFLENLPRNSGAFAVPFVTWGQACSGVALWQLGRLLVAKGYRLAAGAKVLAVHSMMWQSDNPGGKGHPDRETADLMKKTVKDLIEARRGSGLRELALEALDYQPEHLARDMKPKIDQPLMAMPRTVRTDLCTQCGICADACPVSAIVLNPFPEFLAHCFGCMNCVRECPENAIEPAVSLAQVETMIRQKIATMQETPGTRVFMP